MKELMHHNIVLRSALLSAALLALPLAARAETLNKADYGAAKTRIGAQYKDDKAACDSLGGNAKDVCVEQAKGKEKVARAELEYRYTAKPGDRDRVLVARAEVDYAVAKERCDDKGGNVKDVCVAEAKAVETKALADAKMGKDVGKAETEAMDERREADYKVATQKCEALAGDAKTACVTAAKTKFGRN
jgi:hypothetical protein